jgi:hypothetical protein
VTGHTISTVHEPPGAAAAASTAAGTIRSACGGFIDLDTGRVVGRDASDNNWIPPGNKRRSPQPQSRLKKVAIASRSCSADPSPHPTGSGTRRRHVTRSPNAGARRCASPYCPGLSGDSLSSSKHAWVDYWICSEVMNIVCQSRFFLENGSMSVKIYAGDCVLYDRQSAQNKVTVLVMS